MIGFPPRTMAERRLQCRLQERPRNAGPSKTAGPVPLTISQCCTHRPGVKCVQANACPFLAANCPCTSVCPSGNFRNRGPMYYPTAPRLTANVRQNIKEAQEASPILCHSIHLVVFHSDVPEISPSVLTRGAEWAALLDRANAAHIPQSLTKTSAPDTAATAAVGSGKINLNHARPTDGQTTSPSLPADPKSDVTLVTSI